MPTKYQAERRSENAMEGHLGSDLKLSRNVVGSILASAP